MNWLANTTGERNMQGDPYRVVVATHTQFERACATAESLVAAWAEDRTAAERIPELVMEQDQSERVSYKRWRLSFVAVSGTVTATLTVAALTPTATAWIRLDVRSGTSDIQDLAYDRAACLAGTLLDTFPAVDAGTQVTSGVTLVDGTDIKQLVDHLHNPKRRLPLVVASTPAGTETRDWAATSIERVLRGLAGLAHLYVLTPEAERTFNQNAGAATVYNGAIRTYLPGFDAAKAGFEHRVLPRKWLEDPDAARKLLRRGALTACAEAEQPEPLRRVPRAWRAAPVTPSPRGEHQADTDLLARMAGSSRELRGIRRSASRVQRVEAGHHRDYAAVQAERDALKRRCAEKDQRLKDYEATFRALGWSEDGQEQACDRPGTFAELLDQAEQLPGLLITADRKTTTHLDRHHQAPHWVALTWSGLIALSDYAAASAGDAFARDFGTWCRERPDGAHPFPLSRVAMFESETVRGFEAWRRQRTFRVPDYVDPSGSEFMQAHLRVGTTGQISPRVYFSDHTKNQCRSDRTLVVGYIGPHLTNTRTC
jgi:hypothetical protein